MKNKTIIAGLAGGVAFFLLGWIIYGMLLKDFMASNYNNCANRAEADMIWWALILSQFVWSFLLAIILSWANTRGFASGLQRGLLLGLLIQASFDLSMHSMLTVFNNTNAMIMDIAVATVMTGIVGGIIGMILGSDKGTAATT
jgi:hypothetical protein